MNKTDKGFELLYCKLSYRRKFIRTLWITPWVIGVIVVLFHQNTNIIIDVLLSLGLIIIYICQLIYTYKKWKDENVEE